MSSMMDRIQRRYQHYPTAGDRAIEAALALLRGEEVPKKIVLGTRLFTPENIDRGGEPIEMEIQEERP